MEKTNSEGPQAAPCCTDDRGSNCGSASGAIACDCGGPPRKSWLKTLISTVILLAALAVGVYALASGRGAGTAPTEASQATPAGVSVMTPAAPMLSAPACCGGGANRAAQAQPSCCGGSATAAPSQPTCGSQQPGCCGR
jgi:hypothetical protein